MMLGMAVWARGDDFVSRYKLCRFFRTFHSRTLATSEKTLIGRYIVSSPYSPIQRHSFFQRQQRSHIIYLKARTNTQIAPPFSFVSTSHCRECKFSNTNSYYRVWPLLFCHLTAARRRYPQCVRRAQYNTSANNPAASSLKKLVPYDRNTRLGGSS